MDVEAASQVAVGGENKRKAGGMDSADSERGAVPLSSPEVSEVSELPEVSELSEWFIERLLPDSRFAKSYATFGDDARALLKRAIAAHFAFTPPRRTVRDARSQTLPSGLTRSETTRPVDFVLLLTDASLDAPALALAALMPALTCGAPDVLVARLGTAASLPHSLLTACELAGQERVAALGPVQAERLVRELSERAHAGSTCVVLYAASPAVVRVLDRPGLRPLLHTHRLRLVPLVPPARCGIWRDAPTDLPQTVLDLLYPGLDFVRGGAPSGGQPATPASAEQYQDFLATPFDLLLVPDERVAAATAHPLQALCVVAGQGSLGLWAWPALHSPLFLQSTVTFSSAR